MSAEYDDKKEPDKIREKRYLKLKNSVTLEQLCKGLPDPFKKYMQYVKNLGFE